MHEFEQHTLHFHSFLPVPQSQNLRATVQQLFITVKDDTVRLCRHCGRHCIHPERVITGYSMQNASVHGMCNCFGCPFMVRARHVRDGNKTSEPKRGHMSSGNALASTERQAKQETDREDSVLGYLMLSYASSMPAFPSMREQCSRRQ